MEKILYLECNSGISGDMTVGALLDLGASRERLERGLESLKVDGYHLHFGRSKKCGIDAFDFDVHLEEGGEQGHSHEHDHDHEHPHGHGQADENHQDHDHPHGSHGVCACGEDHDGHIHSHDHEHPHDHEHAHDHEHPHSSAMSKIQNGHLNLEGRAIADF